MSAPLYEESVIVNEQTELETLRETAKHYKVVFDYVINLDMQQEMLDLLIAEDNWESWAELYHALGQGVTE